MGAFHQGAEKLEHLARGQIDGGRKLEASCQRADSWGYFTKGQIAWNTLPGGRYLGTFHPGAE